MADAATGSTQGRASGTGDTVKQAGRSAHQGAKKVARQADSPWVKALGQVGVAAIGVVYLLLAWIALQVAFGGTDKPADNTGALSELAGNAFGRVLLAVMALGLFAYTVWQVVEAVVGFAEKSGNEKLAKRAAAGGKAVIGLALGVQAAKFAIGGGSGESSSQKQGDWTANLLGAPAGKVLVVLVGLGVLGFAGYLVYAGWVKKFVEKVEGGLDRKLTRLGQVGWIARGAAFGVLGVLVVFAGLQEQPEKASGLDAALKTLAGQAFGPYLLSAVAVGLAAYGVFMLVTSPRRREG